MSSYQDEINKDCWYCIYTKPKQEFRAAQHLLHQGAIVFLPTIFTYGSKKSTSQKRKLLFPRYLFIKTNLNQMSLTALRSTRGVSNLLCLSMSRKPISIDPSVIAAIEKFSKEWEETLKVKVGQSVIIKDGPAKGIAGMVQKLYFSRDGYERVSLLIDFVTKSQTWELDIAQIDPSP